jgi:hypothetical protein
MRAPGQVECLSISTYERWMVEYGGLMGISVESCAWGLASASIRDRGGRDADGVWARLCSEGDGCYGSEREFVPRNDAGSDG